MGEGDELLRAARNGDREASEKLIKQNSGLIWSVVRRYIGRGVDPDDLYQLGCVGFLKAIVGFDETYGTQFSTYAVPKISGEMRRFLRDDGTIKVSRSLKERAHTVRSARAALEQQLGREPRLSEVCKYTGLEPEDIATCETATASTESLQRECGTEGFTIEQSIGDWEQEEKMLELIDVHGAVGKLPEKERMVILLRYFRGMTQENTARVIGVSQVQVSRLERRAVDRLREYLKAI